jgi:exonuclease III
MTMLRIATWNMDHWKHPDVHGEAWAYLFDVLRPDIALLQECAPPAVLPAGYAIFADRAYPTGKQPWGTAVLVRDLPARRVVLDDAQAWIDANVRPPDVDGAGRLDGWCVSALVTVAPGRELLVTSVHNPSYPIDPAKLATADLAGIRIECVAGVWILDVVSFFVARRLPRPLLLGGDFNSSRRLDRPGEPAANAEFFDRLAARGLVSLHRKFNDEDEQTFFRSDVQPHQLDYLLVDPDTARRATRCEVGAYADVERWTDHAPLVAEISADAVASDATAGSDGRGVLPRSTGPCD